MDKNDKPPPYTPVPAATETIASPPGYGFASPMPVTQAMDTINYPSQPAPGYQPYPTQPTPGYQPYPTQPTPGYQVYSAQPITTSQPTYGATAITIQPQEIIVVGACPACRIGVLEDDYTCLGICCAIFFFPLGILACLALKNRRCSNCGAYFG